ncbi:hypothetical protein [Candidatus Mesenet endosymbiont of Agriotes lineatus]|uniref:hypothetical protein n=1 Tax=Candidatus Mesenet endosymbiont of Agriotes lineatus TaxID=3077948 RepID=UPI0030CED7FD
MTLYIGSKSYNNSNNLSDLLNVIKSFPFQKEDYYLDDSKLCAIFSHDDIINLDDEDSLISLQSDIFLIVKNLTPQRIIRVTRDTTKDFILEFLSAQQNKIEVIIVGDSCIENQFHSDMDDNTLKVLDVLTNYQHGNIVINNYIANRRKKIKVDPELYSTVNLDYNTDEDHDAVQVNTLIRQQGQTDSRKTTNEIKNSLNRKPFICGSSTTLVFLAVATMLHFSSSNFIAQMVALVFTATSIFAGLIVGLVMHYCIKPNQKLEDMKLSKSIEEEQIIKN